MKTGTTSGKASEGQILSLVGECGAPIDAYQVSRRLKEMSVMTAARALRELASAEKVRLVEGEGENGCAWTYAAKN